MSDREMPGWGKLLSHFERDVRLASDEVREQAREYLDLIRRSRLASRHAEADEYERNLLALFPPASSLGDAEGDTE